MENVTLKSKLIYIVKSNILLLWWGWSTFWGIFMLGFTIYSIIF